MSTLLWMVWFVTAYIVLGPLFEYCRQIDARRHMRRMREREELYVLRKESGESREKDGE